MKTQNTENPAEETKALDLTYNEAQILFNLLKDEVEVLAKASARALATPGNNVDIAERLAKKCIDLDNIVDKIRTIL